MTVELTSPVTAQLPLSKITSLSPADGSASVPVSANLQISFDQIVSKGTGVLSLRRKSDDVELMSFTQDSSSVGGWGSKTLSIDPSIDLEGLTEIYVHIESGMILDEGGKSIAISSPTEWTFTTQISAPLADLSSVDAPVKLDMASISPTFLAAGTYPNIIEMIQVDNGEGWYQQLGGAGSTYYLDGSLSACQVILYGGGTWSVEEAGGGCGDSLRSSRPGSPSDYAPESGWSSGGFGRYLSLGGDEINSAGFSDTQGSLGMDFGFSSSKLWDLRHKKNGNSLLLDMSAPKPVSAQSLDIRNGLSYAMVFSQSAGASMLGMGSNNGVVLGSSLGSAVRTGSGALDYSQVKFDTSPLNTGLKLVMVRKGSTHASHELFVNGVKQTTPGDYTVDGAPVGNAPIVLGAQYTNGNQPSAGRIFELVMFDERLGDNDFLRIQNYLLDKYKIGNLSLSVSRSGTGTSSSATYQIGPAGWTTANAGQPDYNLVYQSKTVLSGETLLVDHLKAGETYELRISVFNDYASSTASNGTFELLQQSPSAYMGWKTYRVVLSGNASVATVVTD
jgi:hypothetical protein